MSCADCEKRLPDLAGGELAGSTLAQVTAHLDGCTACQRSYEELAGTVSLLRRVGEEELPDGFEAALHRKLVAAGAPKRPSGLRAWLGEHLSWKPLGMLLAGGVGALALSVAVRGLPSIGAASKPGVATAGAAPVAPGPVAPTFRIPATRLAVVKIDFVAEQAVEDVAFAITLPEGLHFVSGGRELPDRQFSWTGKLTQGSNLVPVAVRGKKAGRYTVSARATAAGLEATHDVVLEVTAG